MSQQERGRGRIRGGFGRREGRGGFNSGPSQPYFPESNPYPESSYPPPQYSPSGMHSPHSYQPPISQPSVHLQPTVSPLPPQYPSQSVISVSVIQAPAPVPAGPYYIDRQPVQSPASYFQPNIGGPLPPKYENMGPAPYPRGDNYAGDHLYQQQYRDRDNLPQSYDHFPDTGRKGSLPPQSYPTTFNVRQDQHTSQQKYYSQEHTYDHTRQQKYSGPQQQHTYDHTSQQKYSGPQQRTYDQTSQQKYSSPQQRTYDQTSQQKYSGPQHGHAIPARQKKIDTQQKQDFSKSQKQQGFQQKRGHPLRQTSASRSQRAPPQEPPPPYESLSFGPGSAHQGKEQFSQNPSMEDKTGKKVGQSKPQKQSKNDNSPVFQSRLASADGNISGVRDSSQQGIFSKDKSRSQSQSSQECTSMPNRPLRNRQHHKKKSSSSQGDRCEEIIPDSKDIKEKERLKFSGSSNIERPASTSTRGRDRKRGRGYYQGKGKHYEKKNLDKINSSVKTESVITDNVQINESQLKSGVTAEANEHDREFVQNKKSHVKVRRKKRVRHAPDLEKQVLSSCYITKASLQILTPFKDAASLKETVQLFTDQSETHRLQFLDDSIICSEKRSVCTVMVTASDSQVGKHVIRDLCERLRKNLNIKVMYDISSAVQEQTETDSSQDTSKQFVDSASTLAAGTQVESKQPELSSAIQDLENKIDKKDIGHSGTESIDLSNAENSDGSDAENSDGSDAENSDGSDAENSDGSDAENSNGSDAENSDGSNAENSDGLDAENRDLSGTEISDGSDAEDDEGPYEEGSEGADHESSEGPNDGDGEGPNEGGSEGPYEENRDEPDDGGSEGSDDGDNGGPFEGKYQGVDEENSQHLNEAKNENLDDKHNASLSKENDTDVDKVNSETKLSVVVDKVFPSKADFLGLLSRICGDKCSLFELVPDSVVMATSSTLCELVVPSKLDARKLVQQVNSSRLEDMHVRCFIVSGTRDSM